MLVDRFSPIPHSIRSLMRSTQLFINNITAHIYVQLLTQATSVHQVIPKRNYIRVCVYNISLVVYSAYSIVKNIESYLRVHSTRQPALECTHVQCLASQTSTYFFQS